MVKFLPRSDKNCGQNRLFLSDNLSLLKKEDYTNTKGYNKCDVLSNNTYRSMNTIKGALKFDKYSERKFVFGLKNVDFSEQYLKTDPNNQTNMKSNNSHKSYSNSLNKNYFKSSIKKTKRVNDFSKSLGRIQFYGSNFNNPSPNDYSPKYDYIKPKESRGKIKLI